MSDQSERLKAIGEATENIETLPPLVTFHRHKLGVVTAVVGGFEIRGKSEGELSSRLRKYLIRECTSLPSRFTAEQRLTNIQRALDEPSELLAEIRKREEAERLIAHLWSQHLDEDDRAICWMRAYVKEALGQPPAGGCGLPGHESEVEHGKD